MRLYCESTYSSEGPQCPYCEHTLTPDDPGYYNERDYTEDECPKCRKTFEVEVEQTVSWICRAIEEDEAESDPPAKEPRP